MTAVLFVVATPIGNLEDLSPRALRTLQNVDLILAEDTRHTGHLLQRFGINTPTQSLHAHNEKLRQEAIAALFEQGKRLALVSDAGTPAISDPGALVVEMAHAMQIPVRAIAGPSALAAALSVAGFSLHQGAFFAGFLPRKGVLREQALVQIDRMPGVVVLYESPERVVDTLRDLAERMPDRPACVSREITKLHEENLRGTLVELVVRYADDARGEFVIVLGNNAREEVSLEDAAILDALARCFAAGMSSRDAASAVAAVLDLPKKRCYALAQHDKL